MNYLFQSITWLYNYNLYREIYLTTTDKFVRHQKQWKRIRPSYCYSKIHAILVDSQSPFIHQLDNICPRNQRSYYPGGPAPPPPPDGNSWALARTAPRPCSWVQKWTLGPTCAHRFCLFLGNAPTLLSLSFKMASDSASAMVPWCLRCFMPLRIKRLLTYSHQNGYASPFSSHATRKREKRIRTRLEKKNWF